MDSLTEVALMTLIDENRDVLLGKSNVKEVKDKRLQTWDSVAEDLFAKTGKRFTSSQIQKKWSNKQQRIKDITKYAKLTGGGPCSAFNDTDKLVLKILGENNPKVCMAPGALHNSNTLIADISTVDPEDDSSLNSSNLENTATSSSTKSPSSFVEAKVPRISFKRHASPGIIKSKVTKPEDDLNALHREVLLLQKEKLQLSIQKLKRDLNVVQVDKHTQTQPIPIIYEYVSTADEFTTYNSFTQSI